jgi:hypothetical protein
MLCFVIDSFLVRRLSHNRASLADLKKRVIINMSTMGLLG